MLGLNYDGNTESGVIFNTTYHWGAVYHGVQHRPALSFPYHTFVCHPRVNRFEVVQADGEKRPLEQVEIDEINLIAASWVQPLGQEGNPTPEQAKAIELGQARQALEAAARELCASTPLSEMISWTPQEVEARALAADPLASTPLLSGIAISRGAGETREQLAQKVIAAADYYRGQYAGLLGAYQKQCKDIELKYAP